MVSVVMPTLNQSKFIADALYSIVSQSYVNLEVIIADGGSTDNTVDILEKYSAEDKRIRWFSELDTGPAQALNRAIRMAHGTVIGWLNSDDLYVPAAIERAINKFTEKPRLLMVYGGCHNVDESGKYISDYPTLPPSTRIEKFIDGCFISQPTVFLKRTLFHLVGYMDESLKTAFDFDYWLRIFKTFQDRIDLIPFVQAFARTHSGTITLNQQEAVVLEGMRLLHKHLNCSPINWALTYLDKIKKSSDYEKYSQKITYDNFLKKASYYLTIRDRFIIEERAKLELR